MLTPPIPGLPAGWRPVLFQRSVNHPRDAVVMCERTDEPNNPGLPFVVWHVNMIEGGCHNGKYVETYPAGASEFNNRAGRLR